MYTIYYLLKNKEIEEFRENMVNGWVDNYFAIESTDALGNEIQYRLRDVQNLIPYMIPLIAKIAINPRTFSLIKIPEKSVLHLPPT